MLQREHSAILLTFIKLQFAIMTFVLSIFEWPLKTGFTVFFYTKITSLNVIVILVLLGRFHSIHVDSQKDHFYLFGRYI